MLEQILSNMYIDPELLAELDDEQKHVLFFKMREEQVRRWKKWESELTEDEKKSTFIPTKPQRAVNLNVSFATGSDGQLLVNVINDQTTEVEKTINEKRTAVTKKSGPSPEPMAMSTTSSVKKPVSDEELPGKNPTPTPVENSGSSVETPKSEALAETSAVDDVFDSRLNDLNEMEWQNSLKKSKEHDEMRRVIARMIRISMSEKPQPKPAAPVSEPLNAQPSLNNNQSSKPAVPASKPLPVAKPGWMKASKPTSRDDIIAWFQSVEQNRNAGWEPGSRNVATWFHGIISRDEAENYLNGQRIGSFIVRISERVWGYVVSYLGSRSDQLHGQIVPQVKHYLVDAGARGYRFFGADRITHPSLCDLVQYHMSNPISLTGNETLKFPIGQNREIPDYSELFANLSQVDEVSHL